MNPQSFIAALSQAQRQRAVASFNSCHHRPQV
jgi:hypothetical protein